MRVEGGIDFYRLLPADCGHGFLGGKTSLHCQNIQESSHSKHNEAASAGAAAGASAGAGSGTIKKYGLVGRSVSLREWALRSPPSHLGASLLLFAFGTKCKAFDSSSPMSAWALPCSCLDDNGLNL